MKPTDARSAARLQRIREHLRKADMSLHDLAAAIVITPHWAKPYTTYLLEAQEIHITGWVQTEGSGPYMPVFSFGPGANEPKPIRLVSAVRNKRSRARVQRDPDRHAKHLAKRRLKWRIQKLKPQGIFAALGI